MPALHNWRERLEWRDRSVPMPGKNTDALKGLATIIMFGLLVVGLAFFIVMLFRVLRY